MKKLGGPGNKENFQQVSELQNAEQKNKCNGENNENKVSQIYLSSFLFSGLRGKFVKLCFISFITFFIARLFIF